MINTVRKIESLYVAYAPDLGVGVWGTCWEDAFNTLTEELRNFENVAATGEERKNQP